MQHSDASSITFPLHEVILSETLGIPWNRERDTALVAISFQALGGVTLEPSTVPSILPVAGMEPRVASGAARARRDEAESWMPNETICDQFAGLRSGLERPCRSCSSDTDMVQALFKYAL
jgi:hypothetical protein